MPANGKPTACPACHAPALAVRVPYLDRPVLLEPEQLPITTDLEPLIADALAWQYLGPRIGWEPLHVAARTWRPVHGRHLCRGEHKNENEKGTPQ